jgi:two-component system cell cycle sensor histidine kinase/response regulator CckA
VIALDENWWLTELSHPFPADASTPTSCNTDSLDRWDDMTNRPVVVNLKAVVGSLKEMLRRAIPQNIALTTQLDDSSSEVSMYPGQIEQVIMSLVLNSSDAMPNGGQLTIETRNIELDETFAEIHKTLQPGPHVMIAVSDTGTGMDKATQQKMFEPFCTTKGSARETGPGLSTAYGIVRQSGGDIQAYSEAGHGTTVKIYLPQVERAASRSRLATPVPAGRGTERILVVDDSAAIANAVKRVLGLVGYTVLTAASGPDALQLLARRDGPVHLAMTDLLMPGMSGVELGKQVAQVHPGIKVLYTSGYTSGYVRQHGLLGQGVHFIEKPYSFSTLTNKVREVLNS